MKHAILQKRRKFYRKMQKFKRKKNNNIIINNKELSVKYTPKYDNVCVNTVCCIWFARTHSRKQLGEKCMRNANLSTYSYVYSL